MNEHSTYFARVGALAMIENSQKSRTVSLSSRSSYKTCMQAQTGVRHHILCSNPHAAGKQGEPPYA